MITPASKGRIIFMPSCSMESLLEKINKLGDDLNKTQLSKNDKEKMLNQIKT